MNTTFQIVMIGAGEYKSFGPEPSMYFARFARSNGAFFDLALTEEQLGEILSFTASQEEEEAPPAAPPADPPPSARVVALAREPEGEDSPLPPVQLRRPLGGPQLFASTDEDRDL